MAKLKSASGIDLNEDIDFQRREWTFQRIGWLVMALVVAAGLLGLLGKGPLGKGSSSDPARTLSIEYDRLERYQAPGRLKVRAGPNTAQGEELRLALSQDYVQRLQIERIEPQPDSVELAGEDLIYVFKVAEAAQPSEVLFHYRFEKFGSASARLGIDGGPELSFSQFVFP